MKKIVWFVIVCYKSVDIFYVIYKNIHSHEDRVCVASIS